MLLNRSNAPAWYAALPLIRWCLVMLLVASSLNPIATARVARADTFQNIAAGILTVGGLLVSSRLAQAGIENTIQRVSGEVTRVLQQTSAELDRLIDLLETKYQDNLDLTLDSLDRVAAGQFGRAYTLVLAIDQILYRNIGELQASAAILIAQVAVELRAAIDYLIQKSEQLVLVAAQSGVWVVDNLWETLLSVIALAYLGGLLLIAYGQAGSLVQKEPMISRRRLGILGGVFGLLLIAGLLLLFWKPLRAAIMTRTVPALQQKLEANASPQLFAVVPMAVPSGREGEANLIGSHLPSDEPKATVGGIAVPVKLHQADQVVLTLSGEVTHLQGAQPIVLHYDSINQDFSAVLNFVGPGPDLVIDSLTFSPTVASAGEAIQFTLQVGNQGEAVKQYVLQVSFGHPDVADETIDVAEGLEQGATRDFSFSRTYNEPGHYVITTRIVSSTASEQVGPSRDNNQVMQEIDVQPASE